MNMIAQGNDFLTMYSDQLYDNLIAMVSSDVEAKEKLNVLKASERYTLDYEFRTMIDFAYLLNDSIREKNRVDLTKRIMRCFDIIDRATALQIWQLAANAWNVLAVFYDTNLMYERALECYNHAIRIEEQQGLYKLSPIIYTNMVGIFLQIEEIDKALEYINKAEKLMEEKQDVIPRYWDKIIYIYANYIRIKIKKGQYQKEEIEPYYQKVLLAEPKLLSQESKAMVLNAKFYYGFFYFEKERFDENLEKIKEVFGEQQYILYCHQCIEFSKMVGRDYEPYIERLIEFEKDDPQLLPLPNLYTYNALMEYYEKKNDQQKLSGSKIKYIKLMSNYLEELAHQQVQTLNTIEQLFMNEENREGHKLGNVEDIEFKLIADETLKTKQELEKAYERLEVTGELGRKITATTDLDEVVKTIYRVLKEHVPLDYFALMYEDEEINALRSAAIYYKDRVQEDVIIELDDEKSSSARCFYSKQILKNSGPINFTGKRIYFYDDTAMASYIFMPLVVANKAVGVFSIQSSLVNAYEGENFEFLKEIVPYLSIAINNAVKSWMIEKEVEHRKQIQRELEEANRVLSKLSSMDGLTQIGSRRAFDEKFRQMMIEAQETKKRVCVFMMDIDSFKLYNDTYGHLLGDEVLKKVASIFRQALDEVDGLSARFGGEEFIGAAMGLNEKEAEEVAAKIRDQVEDLKLVHEAALSGRVTVSIGVAVARHAHINIKSKLMRYADECLYVAKAVGKNNYILKTV